MNLLIALHNCITYGDYWDKCRLLLLIINSILTIYGIIHHDKLLFVANLVAVGINGFLLYYKFRRKL